MNESRASLAPHDDSPRTLRILLTVHWYSEGRANRQAAPGGGFSAEGARLNAPAPGQAVTAGEEALPAGNGKAGQAAVGGAIRASSRGDRDAAKMLFHSSMRAGSIVATMALLMSAIARSSSAVQKAAFAWRSSRSM